MAVAPQSFTGTFRTSSPWNFQSFMSGASWAKLVDTPNNTRLCDDETWGGNFRARKCWYCTTMFDHNFVGISPYMLIEEMEWLNGTSTGK